jgi:hypothetical protein
MSLYRITADKLEPVTRTTFAATRQIGVRDAAVR